MIEGLVCPAGGTRQLHLLVATDQSLGGKGQLCSVLNVLCSRGNPDLRCFNTHRGDSPARSCGGTPASTTSFVMVESGRLLPPTLSVRDVPGRASGGAPLEQSLDFWLHL